MSPGPIDVHTHPRALDALTYDDFVPVNNGHEGKAGLWDYTTVALASGITAIIAMPNEAVRRYDVAAHLPERTELVQHPIATLDRVITMEQAINSQAVTPTAIHFGIDPAAIFKDEKQEQLVEDKLSQLFASVRDECTSVKFYFADTTGGNNVGVRHGARLIKLWHDQNPEKPSVCHVEGNDAYELLKDGLSMPRGKEIPIHIAHVSSRQEMEAVLWAKQNDMNVTCEVTPHHLFLTDEARLEIGPHGCMKPGLKTQADIEFLWKHINDIDIFASDCAPHRPADKIGGRPTYGVTNHTVMLPLLLGAVEAGRLTMQDINQKFCITPRQRFNLPLEDGSFVQLSTRDTFSARHYEIAKYGATPFSKLTQKFHLVGEILVAQAGVSRVELQDGQLQTDFKNSYSHLIRPKNLARA